MKIADALTRAVRRGAITQADLPYSDQASYRSSVHEMAPRPAGAEARRDAIQEKRFSLMAKRPEEVVPGAKGALVYTTDNTYPVLGGPATVPGKTPQVLVRPADFKATGVSMGPTERASVLAHELGEVAETSRGMQGKSITPHASHMGLEPLLREDMELVGHPTASRNNQRLRMGAEASEGDVLVAKAKRQAGFLPDQPIQPGTRRAAAVQRIADKQLAKQKPRPQDFVDGASYGAPVSFLPTHVNKELVSTARLGPATQQHLAKKGIHPSGEFFEHLNEQVQRTRGALSPGSKMTGPLVSGAATVAEAAAPAAVHEAVSVRPSARHMAPYLLGGAAAVGLAGGALGYYHHKKKQEAQRA